MQVAPSENLWGLLHKQTMSGCLNNHMQVYFISSGLSNTANGFQKEKAMGVSISVGAGRAATCFSALQNIITKKEKLKLLQFSVPGFAFVFWGCVWLFVWGGVCLFFLIL